MLLHVVVLFTWHVSRFYSRNLLSVRAAATITLGFQFGSNFTDYVLQHRINSEILYLWIRGTIGGWSPRRKVCSLTFPWTNIHKTHWLKLPQNELKLQRNKLREFYLSNEIRNCNPDSSSVFQINPEMAAIINLLACHYIETRTDRRQPSHKRRFRARRASGSRALVTARQAA